MAGQHDSKVTLLLAGTRSRSAGRPTSWTLPPDLHEEAARRIRAVALVYAAAYLLTGVLPPLLSAESRAVFFGRTLQWLGWRASRLPTHWRSRGWSAVPASPLG